MLLKSNPTARLTPSVLPVSYPLQPVSYPLHHTLHSTILTMLNIHFLQYSVTLCNQPRILLYCHPIPIPLSAVSVTFCISASIPALSLPLSLPYSTPLTLFRYTTSPCSSILHIILHPISLSQSPAKRILLAKRHTVHRCSRNTVEYSGLFALEYLLHRHGGIGGQRHYTCAARRGLQDNLAPAEEPAEP